MKKKNNEYADNYHLLKPVFACLLIVAVGAVGVSTRKCINEKNFSEKYEMLLRRYGDDNNDKQINFEEKKRFNQNLLAGTGIKLAGLEFDFSEANDAVLRIFEAEPVGNDGKRISVSKLNEILEEFEKSKNK